MKLAQCMCFSPLNIQNHVSGDFNYKHLFYIYNKYLSEPQPFEFELCVWTKIYHQVHKLVWSK